MATKKKIIVNRDNSFIDDFDTDIIGSKPLKNEELPTRKSTSDEPLFFPLKDDDDLLMRKIKNIINKEKITLQDIYDEFGNSGYNLVYALRRRNQMYSKTAIKWCEFLEYDLTIKITKRQ
jgi:hypothetical protein